MSRHNGENSSKRGQVAKLGLHVIGARKRRKVKIDRPVPGFRGCTRSRFFGMVWGA